MTESGKFGLSACLGAEEQIKMEEKKKKIFNKYECFVFFFVFFYFELHSLKRVYG
jgi:hypothetical protein